MLIIGILVHESLYPLIASPSVKLCGGNHVTMAVEVLCDCCVTFSRVRFSGGPSAENTGKSTLFQALCQCGRLKKRAGDERGLVEKELIPPVAHSLFRSSSLTESLEQAKRTGSTFTSEIHSSKRHS